MEIWELIRVIIGVVFIIIGLVFFLFEMIGVFKFKYVLNRMHAAAMGDTLGIGCSLIGLAIICGFSFTSLKMICVIAFLWFSSPAASHLIARLEVTTNEDEVKYYDEIEISATKAKEE